MSAGTLTGYLIGNLVVNILHDLVESVLCFVVSNECGISGDFGVKLADTLMVSTDFLLGRNLKAVRQFEEL